MSLKTNIGDEFLPVDVADPNQLINYYESYVLIPNFGLLFYSRLYRLLKRLLALLSEAIHVVGSISDYLDQFKELPPTPYISENIVKSGSSINEDIVKSDFKINEVFERPSIMQPRETLIALKNIGTKRIQETQITNVSTADYERIDNYKNILSQIAKENVFLSLLVDSGLVLGKEGIISKKLITASKDSQIETIVNNLINATKDKVPGLSRDPDNLTGLSESMAGWLIKNNPGFSDYSSKIAGLAKLLIANYFNIYNIINPRDNIAIIESCEWAFVRSEKVTLDLQRPLFRGPVSVNCVSPKSELTITETESRLATSGTFTLSTSRDDLIEYNSISSEITSKLGTLFDYGSNLGQTMSEQGYTQDSLKSEKRSRVESALREISQQNTTAAMSTQTLSSSEIREYRTEGKDPKFATSELSFEVFSPVRVKHYINDIGAVWTPRVNNPFAALRSNLTEYYNKTFNDYILENYVIDPAEPIPSYESVNRVTQDTTKENDPGTFTKTVTFKLTENEIATGYLFGEDIQLEFHQHCDWYENCYDEGDRWMHIDSVDRHGGDSWVDVKIKYHVDNVTGNDPDRTWITVSIDKYKETEAYRQQMNEYEHTVEKTNPARRNAIKVQARKYAALKRDELIRKYENNFDQLKDYAFISLMRKLFSNNLGDQDWSYYLGIIRTCIDWDKSRIDPEPCSIKDLYETVLSPYHFLNVKGVRFFLPINTNAEAIFFDTMRNVVDSNWRSLFDTVQKYIKSQRDELKKLSEDQRLIDSYDSEIILGRHLEAVLSNKAFAE